MKNWKNKLFKTRGIILAPLFLLTKSSELAGWFHSLGVEDAIQSKLLATTIGLSLFGLVYISVLVGACMAISLTFWTCQWLAYQLFYRNAEAQK